MRQSFVYRALSRPHLVMGVTINILALLWGIAAFTLLMIWTANLLGIWTGIAMIVIPSILHVIIAGQFDKDPIIHKVYKIYTSTKDHYHPQSRVLDRMHERPKKFGRGVRC